MKPTFLRRSLTPLLLTALLSACGPGADSPGGVASRYLKAQAHGRLDDQLALVTEADRTAASQPPNEKALTPDPGEASFLQAVAKRIKIGKATTQVDGETAEVTVAGQAPDVDLGELVLPAMFSGGDEEVAEGQLRQMENNPGPPLHRPGRPLAKAGAARTLDTFPQQPTAAPWPPLRFMTGPRTHEHLHTTPPGGHCPRIPMTSIHPGPRV